MKKTIYMTRHGNTLSNNKKIYAGWSSEGLSEDGVLQAEELGEQMAHLKISAIYSSPIQRAIQSSQILNKHIKGDMIIEPDLREIEMGPWEGLTEDEVAVKYPSHYQIWLTKPAELKIDGRETLQDVLKRGLRTIKKMLAEEQDDVILLVSHVAIIRCLLLHFNQLPLNSYKTIHIPNICTYKVIFDGEQVNTARTLTDVCCNHR